METTRLPTAATALPSNANIGSNDFKTYDHAADASALSWIAFLQAKINPVTTEMMAMNGLAAKAVNALPRSRAPAPAAANPFLSPAIPLPVAFKSMPNALIALPKPVVSVITPVSADW